jgi:hypothetical protein
MHVPKTGGTSFVAAARTVFSPHETLLAYGAERTSEMIIREVDEMPERQRHDIRFIAGHQVWYGIHELFPTRTPRYVTFLRDPVARVISDYYKVIRTPTNQFHERMTRDNASLEEFLQGSVSPFAMNHMTVFLGRDRVMPSHNIDQCSLENPALLERAVEHLRRFWFVGLTEAYTTDLARIRELSRLPISELRLNRATTNKREDTALRLIELCANANQMDAHLYHLAVMIHDTQQPDLLAD